MRVSSFADKFSRNLAAGNPYLRSPFFWPFVGSAIISVVTVLPVLASSKHITPVTSVSGVLLACSLLVAIVCLALSPIWVFLGSGVLRGGLMGTNSVSKMGYFLRAHPSNRTGNTYFALEVRRHFYVRVRCPQNWEFRKYLNGTVIHNRATLESYYSDGLLDTIVRADVGKQLHAIAARHGRDFRVTLLAELFTAPAFARTVSAHNGQLSLEFEGVAVETYSHEDLLKELEPYRQSLQRIADAAANLRA